MTKNAIVIIATAALLGACSQFTTNDAERAVMRTDADGKADAYLQCIKDEAAQYTGSTGNADTIYMAVYGRCADKLDAFRESAHIYYESQFMMTEAPVNAEVEELGRRSRSIIAESMLTGGALAAGTADYVPEPAPARGATASAGDRDAYLSCMSEQAQRYASLDESATTIAEVAESTCSDKLGRNSTSALAREGRALVLREVLEARVAD